MKTPVLFLGHGSPMNALADTPFTRTLAALGTRFPKPKAICCISAHWLTKGIHVLESPRPKTIHDFGGFPEALYQVDYPAPGSPQRAAETALLLADHHPQLTSQWGLDHGTWSVLRHVFPLADVPVYQLSLDMSRNLADHVRVAQDLKKLRDQGVWIIGSGNIVHHLGQLDWKSPHTGYDWAHHFDTYVKEALLQDQPDKLIHIEKMGPEAKLAVPSPDHYLPLLYLLGVRDPKDTLSFPYEGFEYGSISMRTVLLSP